MNELLFECYSVPKVAYGIDCMFSYYQNKDLLKLGDTCLIISLGFHTVHIIPVINGKIDCRGIRRINVGGFHLTNYLHRSMQLKYPPHTNNITVSIVKYLTLWTDLKFHFLQLDFTS